MRHGRAKLARRTLQFYRLNTKSIHSPYKILVDGTFLVASIRQKVPLKDRLQKTLQHESFALYITRSTLDELLSLVQASSQGGKPKNQEALDALEQARRFGLDECEVIERGAIPARKGRNSGSSSNNNSDNKDQSKEEKSSSGNARNDIVKLATEDGCNAGGYFVATQDEELSHSLRLSPFVPLFRLGRGVLLMEGPSAASRSFASRTERDKERMGGGLVTAEERDAVQKARERERLKARKKAEAELEAARTASVAEVGGAFQSRRKGKAKAPNPLSCKKRKGNGGGEKKKRNRKRKKNA